MQIARQSPASASPRADRWWYVAIGATALVCWAYIIVRSANVAIVHDESLTYGVIHGDTFFGNSPNNHWLNTLLMQGTTGIFGDSEVALRLPNVLAFPVYAASCIALLGNLNLTARVVGALLFFANPFALEFFSLARGYGLAMAGCAAMLACMLVGDPFRRPLLRLACVALSALVMFYSNFSALMIAIAGIGVQVLAMFVRGLLTTRTLLWSALIVGVSGAALVPGVQELLEWNRLGLLYAGGTRGLIPDTLGSLIVYSSTSAVEPSWLTLAKVVVVGFVVLGTVLAVLEREWRTLQPVCALLLVALAGQQAASWIFGSEYPLDRAALPYFVVLATFAAQVVNTIGRRWMTVAACCAVALALLVVPNLVSSANLSRTTVWAYDESSRDVMEAVQDLHRRHPDDQWRLVTGFPRQQAPEFYRRAWDLTWLEPLTRDPVLPGTGDLYYLAPGEVELPGTIRVASFPSTGTELRARAGIAR